MIDRLRSWQDSPPWATRPAFNPAYGQGITTGALSALTLRDTIGEFGLDHPELPGRLYSAQAELQKAPWSMATGADFAVPGVIGHRPLSNRIFDPCSGS